MRLRPLISALGLNAVPAIGWYFAEWSAGTTLVLYWLETLIGALLVAGRIMLHRRVRPSKGHWDYKPPAQENQPPSTSRSTYLTAFFVPALIFIGGHGIFLGALGALVLANNGTPEASVDPRHLLAGLVGIFVFQGIDFLGDLIWLRSRPFRWIETQGQQSFGRVIVIHLTIIGGMCAVMFTGANRDFFGVFIFLKTLLNASLVLPQYNPETPPAWLCNLMDRIGSAEKLKGTSFAEFWRKTDDQEEARVARNEEPFQPASKRRR